MKITISLGELYAVDLEIFHLNSDEEWAVEVIREVTWRLTDAQVFLGYLRGREEDITLQKFNHRIDNNEEIGAEEEALMFSRYVRHMLEVDEWHVASAVVRPRKQMETSSYER